MTQSPQDPQSPRPSPGGQQWTPQPAYYGAPQYGPPGAYPPPPPKAQKKRFYQRWWFWVLVVIIIIAIIASASSGGGSDNNANGGGGQTSQAPASQSATASTTPPQSKPTPAKVRLRQSGSGTQTTKTFTVTKDEWSIKYSFDCSSFGQSGNFQLYVYQGGKDLADVAANDLKKSGAATSFEHGAGRYYITVNSECDWKIKVRG